MEIESIVDPCNMRLLKLSPEHIKTVENLREAYRTLALMLDGAPKNREAALAKTNLEQSLMWAVKGFCVASPQDAPPNFTQSLHAVIVNGKEVELPSGRKSYEEIVALAGKTGTPTMTVCWRPPFGQGRHGRPEYPGGAIDIEDGLVINVTHTNNA